MRKQAEQAAGTEKRIDWAVAVQAFANAARERIDSWVNPFTGFGGDRDKTAGGSFVDSGRIPDTELSALYRGDWLAAKVIDLPPQEMLRQGFSFERAGKKEQQADLEELKKALIALGAEEHLLKGFVWGRLFGGALLFIGAEDGQRTDRPLVVERVKRISFLQVYDRRRIVVRSRYLDPRKGNFGAPEVYAITPLDGGELGDGAGVHESRCIRFGGALTDDETSRGIDGWDDSILQKVYEAVRQFHANNKSGELMMTDASQGVFKMAGLIKAIAAGDFATVQQRLITTDMGRSTARSIVVDPDKGEDFEKVPTSFGGVPEMLDRSANIVAAASGIPVTVLMGQAPAGLNATGDADVRLFYDRVKTEQTSRLRPALLRLAEVLTSGKAEGLEVVFPPLWQESPAEKTTREKTDADRDIGYIQAGVVTPEEVALSARLAALYPDLDRSVREGMLKQVYEDLQNPPEPPPAGPAPGPAQAPAPGEPPA